MGVVDADAREHGSGDGVFAEPGCLGGGSFTPSSPEAFGRMERGGDEGKAHGSGSDCGGSRSGSSSGDSKSGGESGNGSGGIGSVGNSGCDSGPASPVDVTEGAAAEAPSC